MISVLYIVQHKIIAVYVGIFSITHMYTYSYVTCLCCVSTFSFQQHCSGVKVKDADCH